MKKVSGIIHLRRGADDAKTALSNGGYTMVYRVGAAKEDGSREILVGFARCTIEDSYNRKLGAAIALGRLNCDRPGVNYRFMVSSAEMGLADGTKPEFKERDGMVYVDDKQFPFTQVLIECFASNVILDLEVPEEFADAYVVRTITTEKNHLYKVLPVLADNIRQLMDRVANTEPPSTVQ